MILNNNDRSRYRSTYLNSLNTSLRLCPISLNIASVLDDDATAEVVKPAPAGPVEGEEGSVVEEGVGKDSPVVFTKDL